MRRVFGFLFLSAMLAASLYVLYMQAFVSDVIEGQYLYGAGFFGSVAAAAIWYDFIAPLLRGSNEGK